MSQACSLIYSAKDMENFPIDVNRLPANREDIALVAPRYYGPPGISAGDQGMLTAGGQLDASRAEASGVTAVEVAGFTAFLKQLPPADNDTMRAMLSVYAAHCQDDLVRGFANPKLSDDVRDALPGALDSLLRTFGDPPGLFRQAGAGSTPWIATIKNPGNHNEATGCGWEVVATARLLACPLPGLGVFASDEIEFGPKLQARYGSGSGSLVTSNHNEAGLLYQPDRLKVEADLMIHRGDQDIYVDFKYGETGDRGVSQAQIEGVIVALKTGEIHQAHFVSNRGFDGATANLVSDANLELHRLHLTPIKLHECLST